MRKMRTIYFIVPVYKVEKYLRRCVDSVLKQTYAPVRLILVDDGSPDGCPEICDEYANENPNIDVIHKQNGGQADARNAGLDFVFEAADMEDYITFLDSDDFLRPDYAKRMVELCETYGCDMAQCAYEKGSGDRFSDRAEKPRIEVATCEDALLGYTLKSINMLKLYKARLLKDVRYPKGVTNEEEFTTYRAAYNGDRIVFTNEKLYYYYQRDGSIMDVLAKKLKNNPHRFDWLDAYKERIEFFTKEGKPDQVARTREKICTDIILRYSEQMRLRPEERDTDCVNGKYLDIYRENYKLMIKRRGIPLKRRLIYAAFRLFPYSAALAGRIFTLRK